MRQAIGLIHWPSPRCRRVLPEPPPLPVPPEAAAGLAWHPRALYAKYDAWQLARRAKRLFQSIAPQVGWAGTHCSLQ